MYRKKALKVLSNGPLDSTFMAVMAREGGVSGINREAFKIIQRTLAL
jgi:hypothetical protein